MTNGSETNKPPRKKLTDQEKAARLQERLGRAEVLMHSSDAKRIRALLRYALLLAQSADWGRLYSLALEVAHLCRLETLGLEQTRPILSTLPAPGRLPPPDIVTIADE